LAEEAALSRLSLRVPPLASPPQPLNASNESDRRSKRARVVVVLLEPETVVETSEQCFINQLLNDAAF
jgi:hypothetical protein